MRFAVVQKTLEEPPVEALQRAFRLVPTLTDADAVTAAHDAYGILVKHQGNEEAFTLQMALRAEGIETDIVPQDSLPQLPQMKVVRRLDFSEEALVVYDPLGRTFPVEWRHILMLSAGAVHSIESRTGGLGGMLRPELALEAMANDPCHEAGVSDVRMLRELSLDLMLEVVLAGAVLRYSINGNEFNYAALGEERTQNASTNFTLMIRRIAASVPGAICNRGAFLLKQEQPELFIYPSKNAFHEEMIWLLWRLSRAGSLGSGATGA